MKRFRKVNEYSNKMNLSKGTFVKMLKWPDIQKWTHQ